MSKARTKARRAVLQALYQWQLAGHEPADIEAQYLADTKLGEFDTDYFRFCLHGVIESVDELAAMLTAHLDRPLEQLDPIERAIMLLGAYELLRAPDVPYRVVINEAVELAKVFGAEQGHRYVNGILDQVARQVREGEVKGH